MTTRASYSTATLLCALMALLGCSSSRLYKDDPDMALDRASTFRRVSKEELLVSYKRRYERAYAVVLTKCDERDNITCTEIWKDQGGTLRVGQELHLFPPNPGYNDGSFVPTEPTLGFLVFFYTSPEEDGRRDEIMVGRGKVFGTYPVDELRATLTNLPKVRPNQPPEPTPRAVH